MFNNKGFSLVELVFAMGIFIVLMVIATYAFETMVTNSKQQESRAVTQTGGIVGLEMLRSDIEHIGFGIPWSLQITPAGNFDETTEDKVTGIASASFDDTVPRPVQAAFTPAAGKIIDNSSNTNPLAAYLVIKSNRVGISTTATKWAYVNYTAVAGENKSKIKQWGTTDDFVAGERAISLIATYSATGIPDKRLLMQSAESFSYEVPSTMIIPNVAFMPADRSQPVTVYGVDPGTNLRMPYNRADYYLKKPAVSMPVSCNAGTGILYKGVVRQGDGKFEEYPLLNCVGDVQVEFQLDPDNTGNFSYTPTLAGMTADEIRSQLKSVTYYILSHEGKKDTRYSYPNNSIQVGDPARPSSSGRMWKSDVSCTTNCMQTVFGPDWRNYRWKIFTIVVRPRNLK